MNAWHLRLHVVRPTLQYLKLWSKDAEELVMGTAAQESHLIYVRQLGGGPARGLWQLEPATHDALWRNFIPTRPGLGELLMALRGHGMPPVQELEGNLYYGAAMCRVYYLQFAEPLPAWDDPEAQARTWKRRYNTARGKGTEAEYVENYRHLIARVSKP